jgi:peptidoglycan/xylan/chitin deacetylase (PgdA/CDA1 family)
MKPIAKRRLLLFSIICTLVAISYVAYRSFAVLGPNGFGSLLRKDPAIVQIGCTDSDETHTDPTNKTKVVPLAFQSFLANQAPTSGNLIKNADLEHLDLASKAPQGFYRTIESNDLQYKVEYDEASRPYLHLESNTVRGTGGAWVSDTVTLKPNTTLVYSFAYRSSDIVDVTAEYIMPSNEHIYESITQLEKNGDWHQFTSYIDNVHGAKEFRFVVSLKGAGKLDTRDYALHTIADARLSQGIVSVAFDDGWQSVADKALPLLEKHNIRTTQYIISDASEKKVPAYMDIATLQKLKQRGDEIGSHTLSHCDQTKFSESEVRENAENSKRSLEEQNLGPIRSFAYPYGSYSDQTQEIFSKSYPLVRTSDAGYNDRYFDSQNIRSIAVTNATTEQEFQSWLDYARINKLWLVIVYHRVDEYGMYSVTTSNLERQLRRVHDSKLHVLPISEAARKIRPKVF